LATNFISKFLYLTKGHHKSLLLILFLFLVISLLEMIGTGMVGPFITLSTNPNLLQSNSWFSRTASFLNIDSSFHFLMLFGIFVVFSLFLKAYLSFEAQKAVFKFGYDLKSDLSRRLFSAYIKAPYSFHLRNNSATLIQNTSNTTDNFSLGVAMPLLTATSNAVISFALILLLTKVSSLALVLVLVLFPVVFALIKVLKKYLSFWTQEAWSASEEMIRILNHGLGSLKETRVLGCESYFEEQMRIQSIRLSRNYTLFQGFGNLPRFVIEAFMITFLVCFTLLFLLLNQGNAGNLTSILGIFALASIRLLPAISNLVGNINTFRANTFSIDKLFNDFQEIEVPNISSSDSHYDETAFRNKALNFSSEVELADITFRYPRAEKKSLDGVTLEIKKGESIGLVGKSGAGKTTLVDVMLGLFRPQAGDIKVDGTSIYEDLRSWQNLLGYVPQSIFLSDDTLERNIAFGVPDHLIDQERLQKAIHMAQLSEVVDKLPQGINTSVGERGVLLSGGQRQRVGIARALYHEREILVFDEATAALDTETERLITEATKALSGSKTIIIIAHRLSTIEHCNRIYQLDRGQIVKSGSYHEVVLGH